MAHFDCFIVCIFDLEGAGSTKEVGNTDIESATRKAQG